MPLSSQPSRQRYLLRCFGYWRPYRWKVIATFVFVLLVTGLSVIIPQIIRWIVDEGITGPDASLLLWSVLALLGITLIKGILTYFQHRWLEISSQGVAYDVRNQLHLKLTELSFAYHDRTEAGQLLSRALQDVERIRFLTGRATLRVVEAILLFVATAIILFTMNAGLALLVALTLPLIAWRALYFGRRYRPLSVEIQDQLGVLTTRLEQNLRGSRVVKSFAQEEPEVERFREQNEHWFDLSALSIRLAAVNMPMLDFIANIGMVLIIGYGGWLVIGNSLSLGELVAFTTYLAQLTQPVRRLGIVLPAMAMASSGAERVFEIIDTPAEVKDAPGATPLGRVKGHVRFEDVYFAYPNRKRTLENINFSVEQGNVVALLGATGAGKSTVVNLLARFYDPSSGRILVDGQDIREVTVASLRQQIGMVLQETILFVASVRDNISFGRPDASEEEIIAAAKAAQVHDFIINQLVDGYDTRVGERGATLSGGQKQRIAIARALLTNPRILILDDATASVDSETERLIQRALDNLMEGRTTFVIAHRLSTVRQADLILVLEKGRIIAKGNHRELMDTSPLYAEVYRQQLSREPGELGV
jgi:ATP-binding cassette subfamily B protein